MGISGSDFYQRCQADRQSIVPRTPARQLIFRYRFRPKRWVRKFYYHGVKRMNTSLLPRLKISQNGRFIVTEHGEPFFWLGDTAWELFHRLTHEEAEFYFTNRQEKRFNLIQVVALAEEDGLNTLNRYGDRPLHENDPARPNDAYFRLVDEYIDMAARHDLYVGLLPTWGDKIMPMWGVGPVVFTPENAYLYGLWLGKRYSSQTNIVWIMGGDRPIAHEGKDYLPVWREMARGIREGVDAPLVMSYHAMGGHSSSEWLHNEPWLDVNMMQSGHGAGHDVPVWEMIASDYRRSPAKPVLDGEPNYEDHPVSPWPKWDPANGYYRDHDVRKQIYRSVFAGACGVTYGHHSVWQMYEDGRKPINHPDRTWREALDRPAASQVRHLVSLMESRPYLSRIPDQGLIAGAAGEGGLHIQATRDENGLYALIYFPEPISAELRIDALSGPSIAASWYDPRTGVYTPSRIIPVTEKIVSFTPPQDGPDWVLVLDSIHSENNQPRQLLR
jgi:hypothetical protein